MPVLAPRTPTETEKLLGKPAILRMCARAKEVHGKDRARSRKGSPDFGFSYGHVPRMQRNYPIRFIYVGMSGRSIGADTAPRSKPYGLHTRLHSHFRGRRNGDQFCV